MQWVNNGISIWFFPRNDIPSDISSDGPLPDQWGTPMAFWPGTDCDTSTFFNSHSLIFDTTFCGDWAGNVWSNAGAPGQEQSCAARVGVSTCEEYVRNYGSAFQDACAYLALPVLSSPLLSCSLTLLLTQTGKSTTSRSSNRFQHVHHDTRELGRLMDPASDV